VNLYTLVAVAFAYLVVTGNNVCDPDVTQTPSDNSEVTLGQLRLRNQHFGLLHFRCHLMELKLTRFVSIAMDPLNAGGLWSESWYRYLIQKELVRFWSLTHLSWLTLNP
jgi:hypothetical protein